MCLSHSPGTLEVDSKGAVGREAKEKKCRNEAATTRSTLSWGKWYPMLQWKQGTNRFFSGWVSESGMAWHGIHRACKRETRVKTFHFFLPSLFDSFGLSPPFLLYPIYPFFSLFARAKCVPKHPLHLLPSNSLSTNSTTPNKCPYKRASTATHWPGADLPTGWTFFVWPSSCFFLQCASCLCCLVAKDHVFTQSLCVPWSPFSMYSTVQYSTVK